ncbi:MAG: multiprotein bridging factor aMBF1 [Nanoarchaeota archaeon]
MIKGLEACELCGKHDKLKDVIIEGTTLSVCSKCAEFGNVVVIPKKREIESVVPRRIVIEEDVEIIKSDYPDLIRNARENMGLRQEELAQKIAEKESVIHHLESGELKPTIALARKLERFLKIELVEVYTENKNKRINFVDSSLTIGDLIKMKKR